MTTSKGRFIPDASANTRSRKRGGNTQKERVTTPEAWEAALPGVVSRLRAYLSVLYADTPDSPDDTGECE